MPGANAILFHTGWDGALANPALGDTCEDVTPHPMRCPK